MEAKPGSSAKKHVCLTTELSLLHLPFFVNRVHMYPWRSGTHFVFQTVFTFKIQPLEYWDYRCVPPKPRFTMFYVKLEWLAFMHAGISGESLVMSLFCPTSQLPNNDTETTC